jgi:hypothetical protein
LSMNGLLLKTINAYVVIAAMRYAPKRPSAFSAVGFTKSSNRPDAEKTHTPILKPHFLTASIDCVPN